MEKTGSSKDSLAMENTGSDKTMQPLLENLYMN
jgi:hypothetical protein